MTNVMAPMGFEPIRNKAASGGGNFNSYPMLYSNTSILGIGDLVRLSSGYIDKCSPSQTPTGIFQGWKFRNRSVAGGSLGLGSDNSITPYHKAWNGAVTLPTNQEIEAIVDDDPGLTFRVQCMGAVTLASRGGLVDMADSPGGPDLIFGRSRQKVGTPTTYYNITAIAVNAAGSGYTQNQVDVVVDGVIQSMRPADVVLSGGATSSYVLLNPISGVATNTPTVTIQPKPGYSGSGATVTLTVSTAQTAAQFRVERILEQPFRVSDSSFNTTGYDLSNIGSYSWLEVAFAKHARGGSALYN